MACGLKAFLLEVEKSIRPTTQAVAPLLPRRIPRKKKVELAINHQ